MLWHKTKDETLVNIHSATVFKICDYPDADRVVALGFNPGGAITVFTGTRKECEAELAEIEKKVMPNDR